MPFCAIRVMRPLMGAALALLLLWAAACSSQPGDLSGKALSFKKDALAHLAKAEAALPRPFDDSMRQPLEKGLEKLFQEALNNNAPLPCGLVVLASNGRVVTGRFPDPSHPQGVVTLKGGKNYSRYEKMREVLEKGKKAHFPLFYPDGKLYVVCSPVKNGSKVAGALCLGFAAEVLHDQLGVSQEEFLALDFNS